MVSVRPVTHALQQLIPFVCCCEHTEPVKEQSDPGFVEKLVTQIIKNVQVLWGEGGKEGGRGEREGGEGRGR